MSLQEPSRAVEERTLRTSLIHRVAEVGAHQRTSHEHTWFGLLEKGNDTERLGANN